jgi:hypothetical protein
MSPTVGKKCTLCNKVHLARTLRDFENLTPRERTQIHKTEHRVFPHGYLGTLETSDNELLEFYDPFPKDLKEAPKEEIPEEKIEYHCPLCGKPISEDEHEQLKGYHRNCFYIEEIQDADDL